MKKFVGVIIGAVIVLVTIGMVTRPKFIPMFKDEDESEE